MKELDDKVKKIMVGCPVQNKHWSIRPFLTALLAQDYPKDKISLVFYVNDSVDGTKEQLIEMLKPVKESGEYARVTVVEENWGFRDRRHERVNSVDRVLSRSSDINTGTAQFAHFARVRNKWLELMEDEDYYFSIDSDVVLTQPFALRQLVNHNLPLVAIPVNNAQNRSDGYDPNNEVIRKLLADPNPKNREFIVNILNGTIKGVNLGSTAIWNFGVLRGGQFIRFDLEPGLMKVGVTGACILIDRKVIDAGVEYGPHHLGEDCYFCIMADTFGYDIYVDGTLHTNHLMDFNPEEAK